MKVKAICASQKDGAAYTYRTGQFNKELVFTAGDKYVFVYRNGEKVVMKASRKGDTLYSGKVEHTQLVPTVGNPVEHDVVEVYKQLKTVKK